MDSRCFREYARLIQSTPDSLREDAMISATARVHGLAFSIHSSFEEKCTEEESVLFRAFSVWCHSRLVFSPSRASAKYVSAFDESGSSKAWRLSVSAGWSAAPQIACDISFALRV